MSFLQKLDCATGLLGRHIGRYSHVWSKRWRLRRDAVWFRCLHNRYKGRRGFVIGAGPSLRIDDLTTLQDEITIASNKIYLAYGQTPWRPTFFTVVDSLVWEKTAHVLHEHVDTVLIPDTLDCGLCRCRVRSWRSLPDASVSLKPGKRFSPNAAKGLHGGQTVTFENLQFAVHLGLNPIYTIGCDHYYNEKKASAGDVISAGEASNHFIEGYRKPDEPVYVAPIERMTRSYEEARFFADQNDIQIFNATRGGHLEAFERVDFDSLFHSSPLPTNK